MLDRRGNPPDGRAFMPKTNGVHGMKRGIWIAVLIIVVLGVVAATLSFFQGAGVNRDNPIVESQEGTREE
jgi:hypothetical protein